MFNGLWKQINQLSSDANLFGLNLPMVKDPKTGVGSVSLTLVVLSSLLVIVGLVGKWAGKLGEIDMPHALEFFYASSALYFGRNWKAKATGNTSDTEVGQETTNKETGAVPKT